MALILLTTLLPVAGSAATCAPPQVSTVVTADIQAGIEKHIDTETRRGGGFFRLQFSDRELRMKLVRVHTEYLSNLAPGRHFACVDLVDTAGDVYDVDFFLSGEPGAMVITRTLVHKINGQPFYLWRQNPDRTWSRITVDQATPTLLGIVRGEDRFEFAYRVLLPPLPAPARMWLPLASTDAFQRVTLLSIHAPGRRTLLKDRSHGNRILFLNLEPEDAGRPVEIRYAVRRAEKPRYFAPPAASVDSLQPERLVPARERFARLAGKIVQGKHGDLVRARALYDHVIGRMRYMKHGPGWGKGDAVYACDTATGNCTDFHALFIALARSVGIPARFAIGAAIPSERNDGGIDGYHCWAEFYAEGYWWPVDISEADKFSPLSTYYFGHHPANRIELSRGRDLEVEPGPVSGPINFLAYPVLEVDGKPVKPKVEFSFLRPGLAGGPASPPPP